MTNRRSISNRDFEPSPTVPKRDGLALSDRGVVGGDSRDLHATDANGKLRLTEAAQVLAADVAHQVPEAIDVDHLALERILQPPYCRKRQPRETVQRRAEGGTLDSAGAVTGDRSEDVARMERMARRGREKLGSIQMDDAADGGRIRRDAEQAVVRTDQHEAFGLDEDRPARRANARIDDG